MPGAFISLNRQNGEVAECHGAMAAQPRWGWSTDLAERQMSAHQHEDEEPDLSAGVETVVILTCLP